MISNERTPYGNRSWGYSPKPPLNEETLRTEKIQVERKTFILTLRENPRGRFLRITEDVSGRRNSIIIPAPGLEDLKKVIDELVKTSNETPPKVQ